MVRFLDDVGHPSVLANLDISHLVLSQVPASEIRRLAGRVAHVHISDCDGVRHGDLPPGRGVVDFAPYLEEIRQLEIPGAISVELEYSPEPDRIEEWVTEAYRETAKLLQARRVAGVNRSNKSKALLKSADPRHCSWLASGAAGISRSAASSRVLYRQQSCGQHR